MKTTTSRTAATASLGFIGVALLSGCGAAVEAAQPAESSAAPAATAAPSATETATATASAEPAATQPATVYADGTYTASGQYVTPGGIEQIEITLDIAGDKITGVQFVGDPQRSESRNFQGQFADGIAAEIVGKAVDEVQVDRIAGSSLTSGGFNQAIDTIKGEATS